MAIPETFRALQTHPAPGLHFPPDPQAGCDEYITPTPHRFNRPADPQLLSGLRERAAVCLDAQRQLLDFYSNWNGVELCRSLDAFSGEPEGALVILPIERIDNATSELADDEYGHLDGLEDLYQPGSYLVIARSSSEDTRLVLFLSGSYQGRELAGKIFYFSLDPVLNLEEPVFDDLASLLESFAADPAQFLNHIGYTAMVKDKDSEDYYGAVADLYLADCGATETEDEAHEEPTE